MAYNERDKNGQLTPMALALDALRNADCDCGTDEPGTCLVCRCEAALRHERAMVIKLETMLYDAGRSVGFTPFLAHQKEE